MEYSVVKLKVTGNTITTLKIYAVNERKIQKPDTQMQYTYLLLPLFQDSLPQF